jgi:phosphoglycolate phosphatase-like HAD superfamily hydrolase
MSDPQVELRNLKPNRDFLICIDSDGCVFDSMEVKQKACVTPNIIKHWHLRPVSRYAREASEFVNLYSKWRGINRFPALLKTFDLLTDWPEVEACSFAVPEVPALRAWVDRESKLGNPALEAEVERTGDPVLQQALAWSDAINKTIDKVARGLPPFSLVEACLEMVTSKADVIVCSTTTLAALRREWRENDIEKYTRLICGQEMGSKNEHIRIATHGKYRKSNVLMIGDAFADLQAARANGAFFFPIVRGDEEASWQSFYRAAAARFLNGGYSPAYEAQLLVEFKRKLPDTPPWLQNTDVRA